MRWSRGCLVVLVVSAACADESLEPRDERDARVDAAVDAGSVDARSDGSQLDARADSAIDARAPDAQADAASDARAQVDAGLACADERAFIESHQTCSADTDCAIVGSCSGGFGFQSVQTSVRAEAQWFSDHCGMRAFDGPLYHAVCEQGRCTQRRTGDACGAQRLPDGGRPGCPATEELYLLGCDGDAGAGRGEICAQRCSAPADTRCGSGKSCQQTKVSSDAFCGGSDPGHQVWLCRP